MRAHFSGVRGRKRRRLEEKALVHPLTPDEFYLLERKGRGGDGFFAIGG